MGSTRHLTALPVALLAVACATPPPEEDPDVLAERAEAFCREIGQPAGAPTQRFETDKCTCFPDGRWGHCCIEHDIEYWCGGSTKQRVAADWRLRRCMTQQTKTPAVLMFMGVRIGGVHWLPTHWRWGFGHPWPDGHVWRTPEEEAAEAESAADASAE